MAITIFSACRGLFFGMALALFTPVALAALPGKWHSASITDAVMAPDFRLEVTPNPNDGRFRLHVQGTFTDTVELVIINAEGKTTEKGTFGLASPWCDYWGTRSGVTEGIAILQNPDNRWYPSESGWRVDEASCSQSHRLCRRILAGRKVPDS